MKTYIYLFDKFIWVIILKGNYNIQFMTNIEKWANLTVLKNTASALDVTNLSDNVSFAVNNVLLEKHVFQDFLKIIESYKLKKVARNCSNFYFDTKENIEYRRKETTAEHICSCQKLADYFLFSEAEFSNLSRLRIYELLMYHDDIEIETEDTCISQTEKRVQKSHDEKTALPILASKYPKSLKDRLISLDTEYRENKTPEAKFAHAIDKMDALVHELQYPADWWPKWFSKNNVIKWFRPAFEYSDVFTKYFESLIVYLEDNWYFLEVQD